VLNSWWGAEETDMRYTWLIALLAACDAGGGKCMEDDACTHWVAEGDCQAVDFVCEEGPFTQSFYEDCGCGCADPSCG
jgi:hypothetical protein